MQHTTDPERVLSAEESWALLEGRSFGRLAYAVSGYPEIVPINYHATEGRLFFRTAGGGKLFGLTVNPHIAFEVDDIRGEVATSIILRGVARRLEAREEIEYVESLPLRPWIPTDKFNYVEVEVEEISGREFHLGPEPGD